MKTATEPSFTHSASGSLRELVNLWQNQPSAPQPNLTDYRKLLRTNPALEMVLGMGPCLSWIIDIRTQSFDFVSSNIQSLLGYSAGFFRKMGPAYVNELMHPAEKETVWPLTVEIWKQVQCLAPGQRQNFRFNRKYRLRQANGTYISLLEQNSVLQVDLKGNITHLLTVFADITDFVKTDGPSVSVKGTTTQAVNLKSKAAEPESALKLSKRERQIVKLVAEGYSSKLIADQLFISYHTVNTHRRNIIEKTHSRNTSGLVQFAINNRII